jgi:hypothetical protein
MLIASLGTKDWHHGGLVWNLLRHYRFGTCSLKEKAEGDQGIYAMALWPLTQA